MVKNNKIDYLGHCTVRVTKQLSNLISNHEPADSQPLNHTLIQVNLY